MTNTDLSILADALAFALVLTIGGAVLYAVARATLRRTSRQMLVAGLPVMALLAVALAGTAVWPFARERVNEAVGVRLDALGEPIVSVDPSGLDDRPLAASSGLARPARLFAVASIGTDGGVDASATTGEGPSEGAVDEGADSGSGGDPGDGGGTGDGTGGTGDGGSGGGTDPSPTDEPSPTTEPSPTVEPSPTIEPSPTTEPSPTDDPPGPPWGSPGPPPKD